MSLSTGWGRVGPHQAAPESVRILRGSPEEALRQPSSPISSPPSPGPWNHFSNLPGSVALLMPCAVRGHFPSPDLRSLSSLAHVPPAGWSSAPLDTKPCQLCDCTSPQAPPVRPCPAGTVCPQGPHSRVHQPHSTPVGEPTTQGGKKVRGH